MTTYFTLLTPTGLAKIANAQLTQNTVAINRVAVGDSNGVNYTPTGNETSLKKERWRGGVASVNIDATNPNWIVVEAVIPSSVGGFTLREVALYDVDGDMIAIGNYPDTYKPLASDGSTMDLVLRTIIEVSNAESITLRIDPNVIVASRKYVDDKVSPISSGITSLQTQVTEHLGQIDTRLTDLESGASGAKADLVGLTREVAYMKLKQDAVDRIEGGTVFADDFNGNRFGFTLDEINSRGFKIKNGKLVLLEDAGVPNNVTDSTVVASAYSTAGNGGRKITKLKDGTMIVAVRETVSPYYIRMYKLNKQTKQWSEFAVMNASSSSNGDFSIVSLGDKVALTFAFSNSNVICRLYDSSGTQLNNVSLEVNSQSAIGNVSLEIDPTNDHLHAAWTSKNSTYPTSFNIRYSKSIDGGITWSTVEQVSIQSSGTGRSNVSISIINNIPIILHSGDELNIVVYHKNDGSWKQVTIFNGVSYTQTKPSTIVDKHNLISTAWHGRDSAHATTDYIRFSKSINIGLNWSQMKKLVPGNNPSFTVDKNNKYIITYEDAGVIKRIESTNNGDAWSNPITVGTGTNPSSLYDPTFSLEFTTPPTLYMTASSVNFTGNWTEQVEVPTTEAALIYDIPSTGYVGAFVQKEGNVSINAFLNSVPMESVIENDEYQFTGSSADDGTLVKFRLEISRVDTSNGENDAVTRILGGRA